MLEILYSNVFIQTYIFDIQRLSDFFDKIIYSYNYLQFYGEGINILFGVVVIDCSVVQNLLWIFDC